MSNNRAVLAHKCVVLKKIRESQMFNKMSKIILNLFWCNLS
jgi:hypothetical protein